jgi:hypothetical protein
MPMLKVATIPPEPELIETNIDSLKIVMKDTTISVGFDTTEIYNDYYPYLED